MTRNGLQLPHDHYFIRWEGLRFGEKITITKDKNIPGKHQFISRK